MFLQVFYRFLGRVAEEEVTEICTCPTCFSRDWCVPSLAFRFKVARAAWPVEGAQSHKMLAIFLTGGVGGAKFDLIMYSNFEGMHWILPAYSDFGRQNLWNIEMSSVF